jgi:enoyl-CoA hydratase
VRVTISRPKNLNAMNMPFFNEIRDTFKRINTLPNVRVAILQADGKHFTAGLDLKEMAAIFAPSDTDGTLPLRQITHATPSKSTRRCESCRSPSCASTSAAFPC